MDYQRLELLRFSFVIHSFNKICVSILCHGAGYCWHITRSPCWAGVSPPTATLHGETQRRACDHGKVQGRCGERVVIRTRGGAVCSDPIWLILWDNKGPSLISAPGTQHTQSFWIKSFWSKRWRHPALHCSIFQDWKTTGGWLLYVGCLPLEASGNL